ncbi:MAG TPA: hypothetical protein VLB83_03080 [Candidatus Paceibacterota bacterium]|nr:hypothetical protein [Candidatus Paceibacterota bacterium]
MKSALLYGFIAILSLAALLALTVGPTVPAIAAVTILSILVGTIWFVDRRRSARPKQKSLPRAPSADSDTDIDAAARFVFSRIRLSAHLALHRTHTSGRLPNGWLIRLFALVREHETDLLDMYKFYQSEYSLQDIVAYQRKLDHIRTGSRYILPDPLKAKPLHQR